jgi:type VI secretion system protein ImpA
MSDSLPALPDGFDLDSLLAEIPGDAAAGSDLREDYSAKSPYFRLRDARSEAREEERRNETAADDEASTPQAWRDVVNLATEALTNRSKDLEVAAWLTEALVRQHGLMGLTAGALLMKGLAERYWDGLFPMPDEDGIATRVGPVTGLSGADTDGTLMAPLRRLPLFRRPTGQAFPWWEWERSVELAKIADEERRQQRIEAGTVPIDDVEKEARAAGSAHWDRLRTRLEEASEAWRAMAEAMDGLAGHDGPSTGRVLALLKDMAEVVDRFAPKAEGGDGAAEDAEDGAAGEGAGGDAVAGGGPVSAGRRGGASREDLLRQLVEIAEYFRKTEPNSPLAYTLQDAVRRARMTWPELIAELVPDETARHAILTSLGIRPEAMEAPPAEE